MRAGEGMFQLSRKRDKAMLVCGDVVCLHCAHLVGQLVARTPEELRGGVFKPSPSSRRTLAEKGPLRCDRCGGPVYIEDVRPFTLVEATPPPEPVERKRRRRRKNTEELAKAS